MENLPAEVWQKIFSYLGVEDLARTRRVSRAWWSVINCDYLWRPLLLKQGIDDDFISPADNCGKYEELKNCKWASICFSYYNKVVSNWRDLKYTVTSCPQSTECVVIRPPYMLRTFDPYCVVEVLKLNEGVFKLQSRLPLPNDRREGCFTLQMSSDSVFVVSKNGYCILFTQKELGFSFEIALYLNPLGELEFCSDENTLESFVRGIANFDTFFSCCTATTDAVWIFDEISKILYIWNYRKYEFMWKVEISDGTVFIRSTDNFVYCIFTTFISCHALNGSTLGFYSLNHSLCTFSWNRFGCGFIESGFIGTRKAIFLESSKLAATVLNVVGPAAIALHGTDRLAYCFCVRDNVATLVCVSLTTAQPLWGTLASPSSLVNQIPEFAIEMQVILGKYIVIHGVNGNSNHIISLGDSSIYSASTGNFIKCKSFNPSKIVHCSDNFIVTRGRLPRGGMRYSFEVYSFL